MTRKSLRNLMISCFLLTVFFGGNLPAARAEEPVAERLTTQTKVTTTETPFMTTDTQGSNLEVTSTIPIPAKILASVVKTLRSRAADILPGDRLIITSLDQYSGWAVMTVAVKPEDPNSGESILLNSTIIFARSDPGGWTSAIMGTDAYEILLAEAPTALLGAETKSFLSTKATNSP